jgi:glutathione S-transferase
MPKSDVHLESVHPRIVGRSSSHFTRVVRILAAECSVPYEFQVVPDLLAVDADAYGGNPGLRLPNVVMPDGPTFGSLGGCRLVFSLSASPPRMVWPEETRQPLASNALELTLQAMSTEVSLIMVSSTTGDDSAYANKLRAALQGMLTWLDSNLDAALDALPDRDISYLELSLYCLADHVDFRGVASLASYSQLLAFRDRFAERASAAATPYAFDH